MRGYAGELNRVAIQVLSLPDSTKISDGIASSSTMWCATIANGGVIKAIKWFGR